MRPAEPGFLVRAIIGGLEIDGILVDAIQQEVRYLRQARFGVAHCRRVIAVYISEISLTIDQRIALREFLREPHERVVYGLIPVRMKLADHIAHHARAFLEGAPGSRRSCCIAYSRRRWTGFRPSRASGSARLTMVESAYER